MWNDQLLGQFQQMQGTFVVTKEIMDNPLIILYNDFLGGAFFLKHAVLEFVIMTSSASTLVDTW